jgi:hypothetical protein
MWSAQISIHIDAAVCGRRFGQFLSPSVPISIYCPEEPSISRSATVMPPDALCSEMGFALFGGDAPGVSQAISLNNRAAGHQPSVAMCRRVTSRVTKL